MGTVAAKRVAAPAGEVERAEVTEPSADGGVLVLAQAWATLTAGTGLSAGPRWRDGLGPLLLFVVVALPVLAVGSVRGIAGRCGRVRDPLWRVLGWGRVVSQRRLARFVASRRQRWPTLLGAMVGAMLRQPATAVGSDAVVVVDSTVTEKPYGPRLPGRRPEYSSIKKGLVDGYELVSACVVGARGSWPLGLLPHQKADTPAGRAALSRRRRKARPDELPSKLDLALTLLDLAITAGVPALTVLGDSAFAAMWWLREVAARERHWLVATRQDRRLRIGAEILAFRAWTGTLPLTRIETGARGTTVWGGVLPVATLLDRHCDRQGLPCQAAYFERRSRHGTVVHRWYLVTSRLDWPLTTIWSTWQHRWQIEVLHRDVRQHLHLDAFHVRTWSAIVALVACTSLRASLLAFLRAADPACSAHSTEALVGALRIAACLVSTDSTGTVSVTLPPAFPLACPSPALDAPLPPVWWPVRLRAA
jgi:hypothetical protein